MKNSKTKKICFISIQAYSLFNVNCHKTYGGSEVQLYQLAEKMAENKDLTVSFVVGDFGQKEKEFYQNIAVIKAFPLSRRPIRYITGFFYQLKFLSILKKTDADVYIQRAAGIETGIVALFCKIYQKKFIYMTASSIDVDGSLSKMNWLTNLFYSFGIRNADYIVAQNSEHQILIEKNYKKKSVVIRNSFTIPKEVSHVKERNFILWVGSSQDLKQPEIFLEIAKNIPEEKFIMIMNKNNEKLWDKIKKESAYISNLEFIEKVPFAEINSYFSRAKILVNTSIFEGFPNTFVQATMWGIPVASLNVNPDNFINMYDCGLCGDGNIPKLVSYIKDISSNEGAQNEKGKNARMYAMSNHDISYNFEKIMHLF